MFSPRYAVLTGWLFPRVLCEPEGDFHFQAAHGFFHVVCGRPGHHPGAAVLVLFLDQERSCTGQNCFGHYHHPVRYPVVLQLESPDAQSKLHEGHGSVHVDKSGVHRPGLFRVHPGTQHQGPARLAAATPREFGAEKTGNGDVGCFLWNHTRVWIFVFLSLLRWRFNSLTPKSDQFQISPAASPEILHHTV